MKVEKFVFSEVSSCVMVFSNGKRTVIKPSSEEDIMVIRFKPPVEKNDFHENVINNFMTVNNVSDLAEKCNYTCIKTFTRHFKKNFNNTPYRWMLDRRLEEARHYVLGTDLTFSDISEVCGFSNISHFMSLYKKQFNSSPSADRGSSKK